MNDAANRRVQHATDALITILVLTIVVIGGGMIFAYDWTVANAPVIFAAVAVMWLSSFGWLFAAAARSVSDAPTRGRGVEREPARVELVSRGDQR